MMIEAYVSNGLLALLALVLSWLVLAFPLACFDVISFERESGVIRDDVLASALLWILIVPAFVVLALGFIVTEILIPIVS